MDFGLALHALKAHRKVRRKGWNGVGMFIELQEPDVNSKMTFPYIFIDTTKLSSHNANVKKGRVPWIASQTDMLANDWEVI